MKSRATSAALALFAGFAHAQTPAEDLIEAGHWKRARAIVERRLRETPNDALAAFLMSQINFAFGHREAPLDLAEKAVALAPDVAKYHRQLAEALGVKAQHSNVFQQAFLARRFKKEIDAAIALDPANIQARRDLMEYYLIAPAIVGGDRKAAESVAAAIAKMDAPEGLRARARIAQWQRDYALEEELLHKTVEAAPERYKLRIALAEVFVKDRVNWSAAAEQARAAITIDVTRVDGYSILAEALATENKWQELDATLEEAERNVPDDLTPYYRAAQGMIATGKNLAQAGADLQKYLSQEPEGNEPPAREARQKLSAIISALKGFSISHSP
jgi:predicted Zn-dependent protease